VVVLFYILLLVAALVMRGTLDKYIFSKVINILFESNSEDDEKQ
jgi:hypothetical protein